MKYAGCLFLLIAALLLPQAAMAQGAAADKGEAAATAACKAKSDPSILVNFWKTAARVSSPAAQAELENRAKAICLTRGGGNSRSYRISGRAGPMMVSGTACSLSKPFKTRGAGGGMTVEWVYTPSSANGGTVSYSGSGGGARMAGRGTYTVKLDAKGGSLTYVTTGRVMMPGGGSATNSTTLKLTPTGPC